MIKRSMRHLVGGAGAVVLLCALPTATNAAPVGARADMLAGQDQTVERIVDRHSARHGRRSTKGPRVYGYRSDGPKSNPGSRLPFTYGMPGPEQYPFGSAGWWGAMQSHGHIR